MRDRATQITCFVVVFSFLAAGCVEVVPVDEPTDRQQEWLDEYGVQGPFEPLTLDAKPDSTRGPRVSWQNTDTVWTITNQWADVTDEAGLAWAANSGLNWEEKYRAWVQSLEIIDAHGSGQTFQITTPYGVTLPAPTLECAEVAIFLRVTFASWYGLPFYLQASNDGHPIYLGHFGFRNSDGTRFGSSRNFRSRYSDHSNWNGEGAFPSDSGLRGRGLYGGGDEVPFLPEVNGEPARAGAYFDAFFLNKRVGHFLLTALSWFGSIHLASSSNMLHIESDATQAGDVLLQRWQKRGIGHTVPVMRVERPIENRLSISVATGSMPRRQPVWESGASVRYYFTSNYAGGPGENYDGDKYASLGGGIRRWRTPYMSGGMYLSNALASETSVVIGSSSHDTLALRPARFSEILQAVSPEAMRDAAMARIEAARTHLADHPSSCNARLRREEGFASLYEVMEESFSRTRAQVDAQYRVLADYVFAPLEYTVSRTCCWNSTTRNMYEIVLAYAEAEIAAGAASGQCVSPTIFMGRNNGSAGDGYQLYETYANSIGRGDQWVRWSADESCSQSNVATDTPASLAATGYCELGSVSNPTDPPPCSDTDDSRDTAGNLTSSGANGSICNDTDVDYYRIVVSETQTLNIRVNFTQNSGDLDAALEDANGTRLAAATSVSDNEVISRYVPAGTYYLKVFGYSGATNDYSVVLETQSTTGTGCGDAGTSINAAVVANSGETSDLNICQGEADFWSYTASASGTLRVEIHFQQAMGDLDLAVYQNGERISLSQGTTDTETIDLPVQSGQQSVIHVYGYSGATGAYSMRLTQN